MGNCSILTDLTKYPIIFPYKKLIKQNNILDSIFFKDQIYQLPDDLDESQHLNGRNGKKILIIFQNNKRDKELIEFLRTVLKAAGILLEEHTHYIDLTPVGKLSLKRLCALHAYEYVLVFGSLLDDIGVYAKLPMYQPTHLNRLHIAQIDDLFDIYSEKQQSQRPKSRQLWELLKNTFLK